MNLRSTPLGSLTGDAPNIGVSVAGAAVREASRLGCDSTTIYFIQAENGPVKIGVAADVQKRKRDLQGGNAYSLKVIAAYRGPAALERVLHGLLAEHRMKGEWFEPHPDVLATATTFRDFSLMREDFTFDDPKTWDELREVAA